MCSLPVGLIFGHGVKNLNTFLKWVQVGYTYGNHSSCETRPYDRGDVGCGKTMLMDMLYDTLPSRTQTARVHFHAFMLDIHKSAPLNSLSGYLVLTYVF
jgi:predicted ATPase